MTVPGRGSGSTSSRYLGQPGLVRVNEDQIERHFTGQGLQNSTGVADADFHAIRKTRTLQISASDFGVSRDEFDGDQLSVVGRGAGEADGAVAAESTDFQDAASSRHSREQLGSPA